MDSQGHLDEEMQTTCLFCGSLFRITQQQLDQAHGRVSCGVCGKTFNALLTLESHPGEPSPHLKIPETRPALEMADGISETGQPPSTPEQPAESDSPSKTVSLQAVMNGRPPNRQRDNLWQWGLGIMALIALLVVQVIYYLRYDLIAEPAYQQQVLNLCRLLPCDENRLQSPRQVRLTERNVYTHPTRPRALMISGRLVNEAPFPQTPPRLRISLSDLQGNVIANRLFTPAEYLVDPSIEQLQPGRQTAFRLEIYNPDEKALTYEFDFVS